MIQAVEHIKLWWAKAKYWLWLLAIVPVVACLWGLRQRKSLRKLALSKTVRTKDLEEQKLQIHWQQRSRELERNHELRLELQERRDQIARERDAALLEMRGKTRDEIVAILRDRGL